MPIEKRFEHPKTPFPVGVEYYRAPAPKPDCWDEDFARLSAAGFRVVRSFTYWNWMEPRPGIYELDDFDRMFDLAEKHGLSVWLDIVLGTHGACPGVVDPRASRYAGRQPPWSTRGVPRRSRLSPRCDDPLLRPSRLA